MNPWWGDLWWIAGQFLVSDPSGRMLLAPFTKPQGRPQKAVPLPPAAQAALYADPTLTRAQAAAFLGVSAATLAEWSSAGKGPPFYDHAREVQYPLGALLTWRQGQLRQPGVPDTPAPVKRLRGRPPGSKSKPRTGTARKAPAKPKAKPRARPRSSRPQ